MPATRMHLYGGRAGHELGEAQAGAGYSGAEPHSRPGNQADGDNARDGDGGPGGIHVEASQNAIVGRLASLDPGDAQSRSELMVAQRLLSELHGGKKRRFRGR